MTEAKLKLDIPPEVASVVETLQENGYLAYLVGGGVRDRLIGRNPRDWDVTTKATPEQIMPLFPKTVYENRFGTVTVINEETTDETRRQIEITPFRTEAGYRDRRHPDEVKFSDRLEDDLARRDFTINALAYNPRQSELIDLYGAIRDIKDKTIRTVGNPVKRFQEDALRMLRAIRLAVELRFT